MSIWGSGPLDNDDAADWLGELLDGPSMRRAKAALRLGKRYLDVDQAAEAIVAAEMVAQLRGHARKPKAVLTVEAVAVLAPRFAKLKPAETKALTADALAAVDRVANSELQALLAERRAWLKKWTQSLADLKKRLKRPVKRAAPTKPQPKGKRIKAPLGSIIAIPLDKKRFAFAKVYKNFAYGVYDLVATRIVAVEEVLAHDIVFFTVGTDSAIKSGAWPIIGCEPFPDDESAWGPPMAAGQAVVMLEAGVPLDITLPISAAIMHKGEFRHCALEEIIGLDVGGIAHRPELMVETLIERLVNGNHQRYRVFHPNHLAYGSD